MQSGNDYRENDLLAHVYTVPWWYDSIGGKYPTAFISNLIPPSRVAQHLRYLAPRTLSLYPSSLDGLMPHVDEFKSTLNLAVTHSEYSSKAQRQEWSRQLGVPVLDEYSSEEATRIALEMPDGHYYVCEDTVHLDVLDPVTMEPQAPGQSGIAVITNLLNEAMPFIRYVQGDYITLPVEPAPSEINWSQIASIDGRLNDAFINKEDRKVPAGSILDATYRWMFDCDLHLAQFEIVQTGVRHGRGARRARRRHVEGQAARLDLASGRSAFDLPGGQGPRQGGRPRGLPAEGRQAPSDPSRNGVNSNTKLRGHVS